MSQDTQSYLIFALALVIFAVSKFLPRWIAKGIPFVMPTDIQKRINNGEQLVILDVRLPREFDSRSSMIPWATVGHIPGAINLPGNDLKTRLEDMGDAANDLKELPVFVTCRMENRSPRAAVALRKAGFTDVSIVKGGMKGWKRSGLKSEITPLPGG